MLLTPNKGYITNSLFTINMKYCHSNLSFYAVSNFTWYKQVLQATIAPSAAVAQGIIAKFGNHNRWLYRKPGVSMADASPRTDISTDADTDEKNGQVMLWYLSRYAVSSFLFYWQPPLINMPYLYDEILETCMVALMIKNYIWKLV